MPREQDFLAAILANPEDDTPRLVYADWLQEHDQDERAEFIRVQCELAKPWHGGVQDAASKPLRDLRRRERELLSQHALIWLEELPDPPGSWLFQNTHPNPTLGPQAISFRRGFVESIECSADDWLAHGPAIVACQPIREVSLSGKRPWNAGNLRWGWSCDAGDLIHGNFWVIPKELFDVLPPSDIKLNFWNHRRWYSRESLAAEALSAACLAYARPRSTP